MSDPSETIRKWSWLTNAFTDVGLGGGNFETNALGQVEFNLDLGQGWGATVTTDIGDLGEFDPESDTLVVRVWGGERDHPSFREGYDLAWYAEHDAPPQVPALVAPILLRLMR